MKIDQIKMCVECKEVFPLNLEACPSCTNRVQIYLWTLLEPKKKQVEAEEAEKAQRELMQQIINGNYRFWAIDKGLT